ncbi:MAG: fibrobacter succinogenes major paralogous domain-containing protein [Alistipes sp.]|nr:fibrobacter succinogenes major paralogous domain-containing protein [Alistipes sp.]
MTLIRFLDKFSTTFIQAIAFAPVSGYRTYTSGALTNVGAHGNYWCSSPVSSNANASHLAFNSGHVSPQYGNPRSYAFTVRCVQHLRGCFF